MAFEINAEGVLLAYHGKGGDVVIPEGVKFIDRKCSFDCKNAITSITLPKSFFGQKIGRGKQYLFLFDKVYNRILVTYPNHKPTLDDFSQDDLYAYLSPLGFKNLERIEVHPDNPIYSSVRGVLFDKSQRYLLDIPLKHKDKIELSEGFLQVSRLIKGDKRESDLEVETFATEVNKKLLREVGRLSSSRIFLYGPQITYCDIDRLSDELADSLRTLVCIFPKLKLGNGIPKYLLASVAMGYCYQKDKYDSTLASVCEMQLYRLERKIASVARVFKHEPVKAYYEKIWKSAVQPNDFSKYGILHALTEAIVRGSLDDMQSILQTNNSFLDDPINSAYFNEANLGGQALGLACRYGGVNKLKCLLDSDAFLKKPVDNTKRDNLQIFIEDGYFLYLSGYLDVYGSDALTTLYLKLDGEIRNLSPISEQERIECIKLLFERGILSHEFGFNENHLYFIALLSEDNQIAQYLYEKGADFDLYKTDLQRLWLKSPGELILSNLGFNITGVINVSKVLDSKGNRLILSAHVIVDVINYEPEHLEDLLRYTDVDYYEQDKLISEIIQASRLDLMHAFINAGKIKTKAAVEKFLKISTDCNASEITAMLLEHKQSLSKKSKSSKSKSAIKI